MTIAVVSKIAATVVAAVLPLWLSTKNDSMMIILVVMMVIIMRIVILQTFLFPLMRPLLLILTLFICSTEWWWQSQSIPIAIDNMELGNDKDFGTVSKFLTASPELFFFDALDQPSGPRNQILNDNLISTVSIDPNYSNFKPTSSSHMSWLLIMPKTIIQYLW